MTFDGTITLGTVLQIASMFILAVAVFNALSARMTVFESSLKDHAARIERHEDTIMALVKELAGVVGRTKR